MPDFGLKVAIADTVKDLLGDTLEHRKSTSAAITPDGRVSPEAVAGALPWQAHDGKIEGALTTGSNMLRWHFPQGGIIRQVSFDARTAPSGGNLQFTLSGGTTTETFSLQAGKTHGVTRTSIRMPEGSWARLNVTAANGAADLAVTLQYESLGSGSTSISGGGGSGGGGTISVISVNGQTGVVELDADDIDDTSTTHKFVSATEKAKLGSFDPDDYALASSLALVATTGDYEDLDNKPIIPAQFNPIAGANMSITGTYPNITFSSSGGGGGGAVDSVNGQTGIVVLDADDISDTATTHKFVTAADLTTLANTSGTNTGDQNLAPYALTSSLAAVALSGAYADLSGKPTIPAAQVNADWNAASGVAQILNKPTLHTHANQAILDATTASYTTAEAIKLSGIAAGAEVNVQSDWNAASGDAFIANKPTLGTAAAMASTAFATAAQGTKADTAVQPAGLTKAAVGLGNVDNTSDANKPVSTAQATALSGKASTSHTHGVSDLTATGTKSSATYLRGDNTWNTPPNTTYAEITSAEITTGTASTARTISGRRAQDIVNKARDGVALASSLSLVATSGDYDDLDNKPTIPAQFNPIAGTNMSITGTYPNLTFSSSGGGGGGGAVDSVNGQTGIVVLDADDIDDASTSHRFATAAQLTKLNGIEAGATANDTNAGLRDRATHTGAQPISSITGLQGELDNKADDDDYRLGAISRVRGYPSEGSPAASYWDSSQINFSQDFDTIGSGVTVSIALNSQRYYTQAQVDALRPKMSRLHGAPFLTISSSGTYTTTATTITGLTPGDTYIVVCSASFQIAVSTGSHYGRLGFRVSGGNGTLDLIPPDDQRWPNASMNIPYTDLGARTATAGGEITISPIVHWSAGSFQWIRATGHVTVSRS